MNLKKKFLFILVLSVCIIPTGWAGGKSISAISNSPQPQSKESISGKVTDKNGEALIGVSVKIKGSSIGTITDLNGSFSFSNVSPSTVLVFSYIGMNNQEVTVGDHTTLSVVLAENSVNMDEVVVVGYGTQKKSDITGSVTSVSKDRFSQIPVTNAMNAI